MRKRSRSRKHNAFKRPVIDDVADHRIDPALREPLLKLFEYAMRSISTTLACEAKFDFAEIDSAKGTPCARYSLYLQRTPREDRHGIYWSGVIHHRNGRNNKTNDAEHMEILGHLEDYDD